MTNNHANVVYGRAFVLIMVGRGVYKLRNTQNNSVLVLYRIMVVIFLLCVRSVLLFFTKNYAYERHTIPTIVQALALN